MKKRLNWGAILKGLLFVSSLMVVIDTLYELLIKPFFTLRPVTLTSFGCIVLVLATIVLCNTIEYFKERVIYVSAES